MPHDPTELRLTKQKQFVVGRLTPLWRPSAGGVMTEAELIATRGGFSLGVRAVEPGDTPVTIAAWAVEAANEFCVSSGQNLAQGFDLLIPPAKVSFFLYPDSTESTGEGVLSQLLQQTETRDTVYYNAIREVLDTQGRLITDLSKHTTTAAEAMQRMMSDQLAIVRLNAELADTRMQRELSYRTETRREDRTDAMSRQFLGMLEQAAGVSGQFLMAKAQKSLESGNVMDKFAEMLTDDERAVLGKLLESVQTRTMAQRAAASPVVPKGPVNGAANGTAPNGSANGAPHTSSE